jgi:hypothetical protein
LHPPNGLAIITHRIVLAATLNLGQGIEESPMLDPQSIEVGHLEGLGHGKGSEEEEGEHRSDHGVHSSMSCAGVQTYSPEKNAS